MDGAHWSYFWAQTARSLVMLSALVGMTIWAFHRHPELGDTGGDTRHGRGGPITEPAPRLYSLLARFRDGA